MSWKSYAYWDTIWGTISGYNRSPCIVHGKRYAGNHTFANRLCDYYAFVEPDEAGYEIAYVGTTKASVFSDFAQALVRGLFQKCDSLTMECDDCDPAAMELKSLFRISDAESYDTYILE